MDLEDNVASQSVLAIYYSKGTLGIAGYDEASNKLQVDSVQTSMEDIEETVTVIKLECEPTMLILHPKIMANKELFDLLLCGTNGSPEYYKFTSLKSSSWSVEKANELLSTKVFIWDKANNGNRRCADLCSAVDTDNVPQQMALCALITYMQSNTFNMDDGYISVSSIVNFPISTTMKLDETSMR